MNAAQRRQLSCAVTLPVCMCLCLCVLQLASDAERRQYCRLTSQSSISSHLSTSVEHVMCVMAHHPKYLHCFQQTHYYLMHEDGSLPFDYRHYIAIMVSYLRLLHDLCQPLVITGFNNSSARTMRVVSSW